MSTINVPSELLQKTAQFVQQATPKLEKQAAEKTAWDTQCPGMVDSMISAGVLRADSRDAMITKLQDGGMAKAAELIPFLAGKITATPVGRPFEKQANTSAGPKVRESDRIWDAEFGNG